MEKKRVDKVKYEQAKIKFHLTPLQAKIEDREFSSIGVEYL